MHKTILNLNRKGRYLLGIGIAVMMISMAFSTIGIADGNSSPNRLQYDFLFIEPTLSKSTLLRSEFTKINVDGCMPMGYEVGAPIIPVKFVNLLLPPGKTVSDLHYSGNYIEMDTTGYDLKEQPIIPHQKPVTFNDPLPTDLEFSSEVYNSNEEFPEKTVINQGESYSRGYTILSLAISPISYNPGKGEIQYLTDISIELDLKETGEINKYFRNNLDDKMWVQNLVSNPEITDHYQFPNLPSFNYPGGLCDPADNYDYVIITTTYNGLDDWPTSTTTPYNWTSLMDKHQIQDGLSCTLVTVQDINACSDYYNSTPLFNDTEAHIREFCRDAYQDWGTSYVFIGGDDEWIPAREMETSYEGNLDSDIYWNHLDNSFNADGDNYWGEEGDGGFDLYSELYLGRITCDEPQDVSNWMNKSFTYADSYDMDYLENCGFYGGNTGWSCQGSDFMDYSAIKGTDDWLGPSPSSDGPYPTWAGFQYGFETWNAVNPGKPFNLTQKWADHSSPNPGWMGGSGQGENGFKNAINNDLITIISGIAHANEHMSLDVYDYTWESDYHNSRPFFIHDYGCHCGDMDAADDGVLHSMLFHDDTKLAFGCVYNTGYGWGNFDSTNSSSAFQAKEFWDYFLDTANNSITPLNWQLGKGHAWAIDRMAPTLNWGYTWRSIIQSCLLFADPAQRLKPSLFADHGVMVNDLDVDSVVPHGETITVQGTILNEGMNSESNILINFTVDDVVIDDTIINTLDIGQSQQVSFDWNPDYGTFVVGIEATPVPGENFTDNNVVNKTVEVIAAPDIYVNPSDLVFHVNAGESADDTLIVGNEVWAEAPLYFNVSVSGGSWLSVSPTSGMVNVDDSMSVTVSVDATGMTEGSYQGNVIIDCNDLDEPVVSVPIDLSVVYANNVGPVAVNYPMDQQLPGSYTVNASVYNFGSAFNSFVVNCTITEGGGELLEDFESDDGGYVHGDGPGPGSVDDWEWGTPTSGPNSAHSGSNVWATNLGGDHSNNADGVLDSISVDLNIYAPDPELEFYHWYDHTIYDCGNVKISTDGGATWSIIVPDGGYPGTAYSGNQGIPNEPAFTDDSNGWELVRFDLSGYAGETVMFRWHFGSTSSTTHPGWYIDDVSVSSSISKGPGDVVFTAEESIGLDPYTTGCVEFTPEWTVNDLGFYAIKIVTMLPSDEDPSNDEVVDVVEIASAPEGHVSMLDVGWNFVSGPFNETVLKENLVVNLAGVNHGWSDAVSSGLVSDVLFGWSSSGQSYVFSEQFSPGDGCWIYAFEACELRAPVFSVNFDGLISPVGPGWNLVGFPWNMPVLKEDVNVIDDGVSYEWADAVSNGMLSDVIFGWDSESQSYVFSDGFGPGNAYWLYAFQDSTLKYPLD